MDKWQHWSPDNWVVIYRTPSSFLFNHRTWSIKVNVKANFKTELNEDDSVTSPIPQPVRPINADVSLIDIFT